MDNTWENEPLSWEGSVSKLLALLQVADMMASSANIEAVRGTLERLETAALSPGAGTGGSRTLRQEHKAMHRKGRGGRAFVKGCPGMEYCENVLCDHRFGLNKKPGGVAAAMAVDEKVLGLLKAKMEKDGYGVSESYIREWLWKSGGKLVVALKAAKEDIETRERALTSTGRVNVATERDQLINWTANNGGSCPNCHSDLRPSNGEGLSTNMGGYTPTRSHMLPDCSILHKAASLADPTKFIPHTRDEIMAHLETEDKQLKDVLDNGWKSIYGQIIRVSPIYKTREERDNALDIYVGEAKWRQARSEHYIECKNQLIAESKSRGGAGIFNEDELERCILVWEHGKGELGRFSYRKTNKTSVEAEATPGTAEGNEEPITNAEHKSEQGDENPIAEIVSKTEQDDEIASEAKEVQGVPIVPVGHLQATMEVQHSDNEDAGDDTEKPVTATMAQPEQLNDLPSVESVVESISSASSSLNLSTQVPTAIVEPPINILDEKHFANEDTEKKHRRSELSPTDCLEANTSQLNELMASLESHEIDENLEEQVIISRLQNLANELIDENDKLKKEKIDEESSAKKKELADLLEATETVQPPVPVRDTIYGLQLVELVKEYGKKSSGPQKYYSKRMLKEARDDFQKKIAKMIQLATLSLRDGWELRDISAALKEQNLKHMLEETLFHGEHTKKFVALICKANYKEVAKAVSLAGIIDIQIEGIRVADREAMLEAGGIGRTVEEVRKELKDIICAAQDGVCQIPEQPEKLKEISKNLQNQELQPLINGAFKNVVERSVLRHVMDPDMEDTFQILLMMAEEVDLKIEELGLRSATTSRTVVVFDGTLLGDIVNRLEDSVRDLAEDSRNMFQGQPKPKNRYEECLDGFKLSAFAKLQHELAQRTDEERLALTMSLSQEDFEADLLKTLEVQGKGAPESLSKGKGKMPAQDDDDLPSQEDIYIISRQILNSDIGKSLLSTGVKDEMTNQLQEYLSLRKNNACRIAKLRLINKPMTARDSLQKRLALSQVEMKLQPPSDDLKAIDNASRKAGTAPACHCTLDEHLEFQETIKGVYGPEALKELGGGCLKTNMASLVARGRALVPIGAPVSKKNATEREILLVRAVADSLTTSAEADVTSPEQAQNIQVIIQGLKNPVFQRQVANEHQPAVSILTSSVENRDMKGDQSTEQGKALGSIARALLAKVTDWVTVASKPRKPQNQGLGRMQSSAPVTDVIGKGDKTVDVFEKAIEQGRRHDTLAGTLLTEQEVHADQLKTACQEKRVDAELGVEAATKAPIVSIATTPMSRAKQPNTEEKKIDNETSLADAIEYLQARADAKIEELCPDINPDEEPYDHSISDENRKDDLGVFDNETLALHEALDDLNHRLTGGVVKFGPFTGTTTRYVMNNCGIKSLDVTNLLLNICSGSGALTVSFWKAMYPQLEVYLRKKGMENPEQSKFEVEAMRFGAQLLEKRLDEMTSKTTPGSKGKGKASQSAVTQSETNDSGSREGRAGMTSVQSDTADGGAESSENKKSGGKKSGKKGRKRH